MSATGRSTPMAGRRQWYGLLFLSLGVALIIVDSTIVNVAIPLVIRDLKITATDAQWVQEVYTLVFAALLLSWGRLADRFGRRRLFLIGVARPGVDLVGAALPVVGFGGVVFALIEGRNHGWWTPLKPFDLGPLHGAGGCRP